MTCPILCAYMVGSMLVGGTMTEHGQCGGIPSHTYSVPVWRPWNGDPRNTTVKEMVDSSSNLGIVAFKHGSRSPLMYTVNPGDPNHFNGFIEETTWCEPESAEDSTS